MDDIPHSTVERGLERDLLCLQRSSVKKEAQVLSQATLRECP